MRPKVTWKVATSLDGRIGTSTGESQWITGPQAREQGHRLRAQNDGEYLPNMPTNRYGANVQWENQGWKARLSST